MLTFPKYKSYQDTGEDWLGEIPQHWQLLRTKNIFRLVTEPAPKNNDEELLSVYSDIGVKPRRELEERGNKASTTDGYWFVKKGDVIVNKLLAWMGAIGVSDYDGVTSPAYDILRAYKPIDSKFYHYLFRNPICISKLKQHSKGIMEMRLRLYFDEFGNIKIPYPPIEDQQRIVEFLDRKTSEIDQAIAQKQRLIELLQEQKAILINQAVTKGLKPNVPMRDSGIEWIGEIPAHWKLVQNRRFLRKLGQGSSPAIVNTVEDEGFHVLKLSAIKQGAYVDGETKNIPRKVFVSDYQVKKGDFLMTRGNTPDFVADICYVDIDVPENVMISDLIYRLTYDQESVLHAFMAYFFRSSIARYQIKICARGSSHTMVKVSQDHIKSWLILVPPLNEQREIISYLKCREYEFFSLENQVHKEIEKLTELKSIFIANAVTGKLKV